MDSDYTVVIEVVCWPKHVFLVWNLSWWWGYEHFCLPLIAICSGAGFNFCWQHNSQERPTKILTVLLWALPCTDAYVPKLTLVVKLWAL